jgi:3-dehydroquinate synthase
LNIIDVHGRLSDSRILVGERLSHLAAHIEALTTFVVADDNVLHRHAPAFPPWPRLVLQSAESMKTLATAERIYRAFLDHGLDRSSFIVGIGGGIVCDLAGFAASTYLRGIRFALVPTTLLAQADAGVGGKNGVNFEGYKNMVGVFAQPEFVLCDPGLLVTLPEREVHNGFAEVIKHGFLGDPALLDILEERRDEALALEPELLAEIVHRSILVKAAVVDRDEREAGDRRHLNFGHTLAHALEKTCGLSHGEAVAIGMVFALKLARRLGVLKTDDLLERLASLLSLYHLPVSLSGDPLPIFEAIAQDKKKSGATIDFVFLEDIGRPVVRNIPLLSLKELGLDLRQPA